MHRAPKAKLFVAVFLFCLAVLSPLQAQVVLNKDSKAHVTFKDNSIDVIKFIYSSELDSLIRKYKKWEYTGEDVLSNPYYSPLFGSPTLYGSTIHHMVGGVQSDSAAYSQRPYLPSSQKVYDVVRATDDNLVSVYTQYPWFVRYEEVKQGTFDVDEQIRESVKPDMTLTERFKDEGQVKEPVLVMPDDDLDIIVRKPNFWHFKATFSFDFTQNYISDNWYKGGESNNSLLASTTIDANFNNQRKLTFDNKLEMRLGFQSSHNDEKHKFKTNSDLIRLTNKLGYYAIKNWSYTMTLQSWTQFYRGYRANDSKVYSDFMSPFESLLSIGMDYNKTSKNRKFNIKASISPLALKLKYVQRPSLVTAFGIDEGEHAKWDWGSNITITYNWNMFKNVSWNGRIYYFTDYSKSQIEWENTFNLTINKYLRTKLFLFPRFDDSRVRKEGESYFQFKELLSVGLTLSL